MSNQPYPPQPYPPQPYPPAPVNTNTAYPPQPHPYPTPGEYTYAPPQGGASVYPPQGNYAAYPPQTNPLPGGYPSPVHGLNDKKSPELNSGAPLMTPGSSPQGINQPTTTTNNEQRFQPPNGPQDLWAAITFGVHFLAFLALTGFAVSQVNWSTLQRKDSTPSRSSSINASRTASPATGSNSSSGIDFGPAAIASVIVSAIVGVGISIAYLLLMQRFPKQLIKWTYWMSAIFFVLAGFILLIGINNLVLGVIFIVIGIINVVVYFFIRKRIPFSAVLMATVAEVTSKYTGTVWLGIGSLLVQLVYTAIFTFSVIACSVAFSNTASSSTRPSSSVGALNYIVWLYLTFSMYWTSQVFGNVVHVANSGVFAAWYFLAGSPQGMPENPTLGALKRACTTSFGSVCYGSLLVALIQTARSVLDNMRRNSDSPVAAFIICCLECLLSCVQDLMEAFNRYAYCQVAIYGKNYCRAAKDTWRLIKDRGIDAIIADCLIGNVLGFGMLLSAGVTTLVAWIVYAIGASGSAVSSGKVDLALIIVLIVAAIFGAIMFSLLASIIDSGVACIFVCIAEDPLILRSTKPDLHEKIQQTYPEAAFISMYS